jgi:hypothetical protein
VINILCKIDVYEVDRQPMQVAIDPRRILIERVYTDNVKRLGNILLSKSDASSPMEAFHWTALFF